jgi:hypothetical protein
MNKINDFQGIPNSLLPLLRFSDYDSIHRVAEHAVEHFGREILHKSALMTLSCPEKGLLPECIMEVRHSPGKGNVVMKWLRVGCSFCNMLLFGYDFFLIFGKGSHNQ